MEDFVNQIFIDCSNYLINCKSKNNILDLFINFISEKLGRSLKLNDFYNLVIIFELIKFNNNDFEINDLNYDNKEIDKNLTNIYNNNLITILDFIINKIEYFRPINYDFLYLNEESNKINKISKVIILIISINLMINKNNPELILVEVMDILSEEIKNDLMNIFSIIIYHIKNFENIDIIINFIPTYLKNETDIINIIEEPDVVTKGDKYLLSDESKNEKILLIEISNFEKKIEELKKENEKIKIENNILLKKFDETIIINENLGKKNADLEIKVKDLKKKITDTNSEIISNNLNKKDIEIDKLKLENLLLKENENSIIMFKKQLEMKNLNIKEKYNILENEYNELNSSYISLKNNNSENNKSKNEEINIKQESNLLKNTIIEQKEKIINNEIKFEKLFSEINNKDEKINLLNFDIKKLKINNNILYNDDINVKELKNQISDLINNINIIDSNEIIKKINNIINNLTEFNDKTKINNLEKNNLKEIIENLKLEITNKEFIINEYKDKIENFEDINFDKNYFPKENFETFISNSQNDSSELAQTLLKKVYMYEKENRKLKNQRKRYNEELLKNEQISDENISLIYSIVFDFISQNN